MISVPGKSGKLAVLGAGFIGRHLIRCLLSEGASVAVLDHNDVPAEFAERVDWVRGEFSDAQAVVRVLEGATCAIHLISSTVPGDEHVDITRELSDNIFATLGFLDACEKLKVKRVVFVSSSSVYGVQRTIPIAETAITDPISSHGIQKLTIEKYLLLHRFHFGLDVRIARLSNPFGPGQALFGRQGFIALAVGHLLRGEPILLRDEGRPVRDFIFIDDVAQALARLAQIEAAPAVVNIGSGEGHSLSDILGMIEAAIGRSIAVIQGDPRRSDIPVSVLDVGLARRELNFTPAVSIRDGIGRTLRFHHVEMP